MEKALEDLSVSTLKNSLNAEVRIFIAALDHGSTEDLQRMKLRLRRISDLITEKEKVDSIPLVWGNNSAKTTSNSTFDASDELGSEAQSAWLSPEPHMNERLL